MDKLRVGIIGMGYIGASHLEALRRVGFVEVAGVCGVNSYERAARKAAECGVDKCYASMDELIADPNIDAVHDCTPNHLHREVSEKVIRAGKHIFSEKPLARTSEESAAMVKLLREHPNVVGGVNFCYRMYPLVQDAKRRIAQGEIGRPYLIHGSYLQDWLLYETDYNWRIEPEFAGESRCVGDIGTHWMDLAQTINGSKIVEVCANIVTAMPVRKKPTTRMETFAPSVDVEYEDINVTTEDYAGALIKFANGASGVFQCSQISAGRKCFLNVEVNGSQSSLYWNQETGDRMWQGNRNTQNVELIRNPLMMTEGAKRYAGLAAGHNEGWNDAQKNTIEAFYHFIREGKKLGADPCDFATFEDGHYLVKLTEAIVRSGKERRWVSIEA